MIYKWNSMEAFILWHETIKVELGIPKEGTLEYTDAAIIAINDIRAFVRESEADLFPELIGVLSEVAIDSSNSLPSEAIN